MARKKSTGEQVEERSRPASWMTKGHASNATAEAKEVGVTGKRHILYGMAFSLSAAAAADQVPIAATLSIPGATLTLSVRRELPTLVVLFPQGLDVFGAAGDVKTNLAAGGSGVLGTTVVWGITVDDEESL